MIEPNKLSPFKHFCMSIGAIPSSYKESLTYYEMLEWLCKYLEDTVIPAVNNNAEALEEVQEAFVTLKNYVDNYFDNLDIQQEINDKLDEMAESGQLTDIIAQYLQLAGILSFDTISDLVAAENIVNGSSCYVLGGTSYNDGNGAFYKVRTVTNDDTIDGYYIVALDVSNTLVAERLEEKEKEEYIIIGDSYGAYDGSWIDKLITKIGDKAVCHKIAIGGAGFYHQSSIQNYTFLTYLQSQASTITNPLKIKKIIVCAGYNDNDATYDNITTAINSFCSYCKTTYPNARVYIGMIGFNSAKTATGTLLRDSLFTVVLPAYSADYNNEYGPVYIENSELILKNTDFMASDNVHPVEAGSNKIATCLYKWLLHGTMNYMNSVENITMENSTDTIELIRTANEIKLSTLREIEFTFTTPITLESGRHADKRNVLGSYTAKTLFPCTKGECYMPTKLSIVANGVGYVDKDGLIGFSYDGNVVLYMHEYNNGWVSYSNVTSIRTLYPINIKAISKLN